MARVAALKLSAIVLDIPYGPGQLVKTKSEAVNMAKKLVRLTCNRFLRNNISVKYLYQMKLHLQC